MKIELNDKNSQYKSGDIVTLVSYGERLTLMIVQDSIYQYYLLDLSSGRLISNPHKTIKSLLLEEGVVEFNHVKNENIILQEV